MRRLVGWTGAIALTETAVARSGITVWRNHTYRYPVVIWQQVVDHTPHNHRAHANLVARKNLEIMYGLRKTAGKKQKKRTNVKRNQRDRQREDALVLCYLARFNRLLSASFCLRFFF